MIFMLKLTTRIIKKFFSLILTNVEIPDKEEA